MEDDMALNSDDQRIIGDCIQTVRRIREDMEAWVRKDEAEALQERIEVRLKEMETEIEATVREYHDQLDMMRRYSNVRG